MAAWQKSCGWQQSEGSPGLLDAASRLTHSEPTSAARAPQARIFRGLLLRPPAGHRSKTRRKRRSKGGHALNGDADLESSIEAAIAAVAFELAPLHDELLEDLANAGIPSTRVRLVTSTTELLAAILPAAWDDGALRGAWASLVTDGGFTDLLEDWFEIHGGLRFSTTPPMFPRCMWEPDVERIESVTSTTIRSAVADGDGWFRISATLQAQAHPGAMIWSRSWSYFRVPDSDFELWSEFGPHQEYLRATQASDVAVEVTARFLPPSQLTELQPLSAVTVDDVVPVHVPDEWPLVRLLEFLRDEIADLAQLAADEPDIVNDVVRSADCQESIRSVLVAFEAVADETPGRYTTLAPDNLATVLEDVAGLRAFADDLVRLVLVMGGGSGPWS